MKVQRKKNKRQRRSFDPDVIVTKIRQAVCRDLESAISIHGLEHPIGFLADTQSSSLTKKYVSPGLSQDALVVKTLDKFLSVNSHMANFSGDNFVIPEERCILSTTPLRSAVLLKARALMHNILTDFDEDEWFNQCRHGPGTTIGIKFDDTSIEAKLTFPISLTARVAPLMDRYLQHDFQMRCAVKDFNRDNPVTDRYLLVEGSRATTVDKNDTIRRMIAVEPTGNMFFQQGLMAMMYKRMCLFGLDVEVLPDEHKMRARLSSITSNEATIDWSSASDCLSRDLLRWLLPPKWFAVADMVRSESMQLNGDWVHLNMFSTMGNAVTFPLETLVFFVIGHALRHHCSGDRSLFLNWDYDYKTISVFGDDCIVPSNLAEEFINILTQVGFIVNSEKSFFRPDDDGFRESCGGDYLHGYDVRPYSLKAPHSTSWSSLEPWLYIVGNRLTAIYRRCFGLLNYVYAKELYGVLSELFTTFGIEIKLVPGDYPDDSGLKISDDLQRFAKHYKWRFSKIVMSQHGTYSFNYSRFIYRERPERYDHLHYALELKAPGHSFRRLNDANIEDGPMFRNVKRKGGYVVAKGISCHWHVPVLHL